MELTDSQVRAWLTNYYQPGALADPLMRDVLRAHGRAWQGTDFAVSKDARKFLEELIARATLPRASAREDAWRSYRVLMLSYLEQHSHYTVARLLGISSRQLSREKTKAILRVREALENPVT